MYENNNPLATEKIGKLLPKYVIPSVISLLIGSLYNISEEPFSFSLDPIALRRRFSTVLQQ